MSPIIPRVDRMKQNRPAARVGIAMLERFQELVEEHRDRVYTLAAYLMKDREEAADATQEVLIRLWRNLERLEEETISPWILRVTRNHCFDLMRKRRTAKTYFGESTAPEVLDWTPDGAPSPERRAHGTALAAQLRQVVAGLDEPYRSCIVLREIQDLKYQGISDTLEMPLNTVKVNIHRGRRMLRERMKEVLGHDPATAVG
jgi:RNA polymerase sigma-70 factor (ECF subfamily)